VASRFWPGSISNGGTPADPTDDFYGANLYKATSSFNDAAFEAEPTNSNDNPMMDPFSGGTISHSRWTVFFGKRTTGHVRKPGSDKRESPQPTGRHGP
jgi:hypothetical protein